MQNEDRNARLAGSWEKSMRYEVRNAQHGAQLMVGAQLTLVLSH